MRLQPRKIAEPADGLIVDVGGGLFLTFKLLEQVQRHRPGLLRRARDESVVYSVASAGPGNVQWAIWDKFAHCEAGADPTAHGCAPTRTEALMDVKAAFRRLSHEAHPDKGGSAEAFRRLRQTYEEALALVPTAGTQRVP